MSYNFWHDTKCLIITSGTEAGLGSEIVCLMVLVKK